MTDGLDWAIGQSADLVARFNKKSWLIGTGAQIAASTSGLEAGKHAHCNSTGSGFVINRDYVYNGTAWVATDGELGRTTLTGAATSITLSSLPARKYLRVEMSLFSDATSLAPAFRFNADSGASYAYRYGNLQSASWSHTDTTGQTQIDPGVTVSATATLITTAYLEIINIAAKQKTVDFRVNVPGTVKIVGNGVWTNTAAQITQVNVIRQSGSGNFGIGSEIVVYGHD